MARYPSRSYGRRKNRRRMWMYIISVLLILGVLRLLYIVAYREPETVPETSVADSLEEQEIPDETVVKLDLSRAPEPALESSPEASKLITEAVELVNTEPAKIIEARDMLNEALAKAMSGEQMDFVKEKLSQLSQKWLFSKSVFPEDNLCGTYKVKSGDLLSTIGKQHKVPYEILMEINGISRPEQLRAGDIIKVINGPFHARIYRSTFTMDLYLQNTFVRSFPVGLGKPGRETPTGLWEVEPGGKLIKPTWTDPDTGRTYHAQDPDYPLGSRWIRLKGLKGDAVGRTGIAFHGTNDPNLIGTGGSRGCIRLHNGDAILIYNLLVSNFSQVEVVE